MLKITIDNCHKCHLETITDANNSQYFWINKRDLAIESKRSWQAIFDKCKDSSRQKYRKELTPNIAFQPNKIFVTNDLFEKIVKSCKATNLEFLKLKEKLGLCLYEDICDEQELISMSEEIFKEEKIITQHDVENKQLKEENEKVESRKEENEKLKKENEQLRKNNVDVKIKESIEKPIEIKSLEEDKNTTDWFDRNKFKEILAIIDSSKFNYKNKIGEFKYIDIRDLVNDIRNNTISEISALKSLNKLKGIKNPGIIKYEKRTRKQKELLDLFNNLLDTTLTDKILSSKDENEKENYNDKTLISPNEDDDDDNDGIIKILMYSNKYDEKTMNQNKKNKIIKKN